MLTKVGCWGQQASNAPYENHPPPLLADGGTSASRSPLHGHGGSPSYSYVACSQGYA
jgi:hypothetical protein